jgi:hypothetical protein
MTNAVQDLLQSFHGLSDAEKHEVAVEILKNSLSIEAGNIPDLGLCEIADELFQAMDRSESENAKH